MKSNRDLQTTLLAKVPESPENKIKLTDIIGIEKTRSQQITT
jgi:hypothetical protein